MYARMKNVFPLMIFVMTLAFMPVAKADMMIDDDDPIATIDQKAPVSEVVGNEVKVTTTTTTDPNLEVPICTQCQGQIPPGRHYIQMSDGRNFCSQTCYKLALPKCSICSSSIDKGFKKDGFFFCSKTCLEATYPKCQSCKMSCKIFDTMPENMEIYCPTCLGNTRCFSCLRPDPKAIDLKDGRANCRECNKTAIVTRTYAEKVLKDVNVMMAKKLGFHAQTQGVVFEFCTPQKLAKATGFVAGGGNPGAVVVTNVTKDSFQLVKNEQGKEIRERIKITEQHYTIFIVNQLSEEKFIEVAAHQLAVLWLMQNYGSALHVKADGKGNPVVREGFGEWVASEINIACGRPKMNIRIESNPSAYAGKGYRMVKEMISKSGFEGFRKYMNVLNGAPVIGTAK